MQMTFILNNGREKIVSFEKGETILQIAEKNGINIKHNCEGFGVCGSCHVIIENGHDKLKPLSDKEMSTLDRSNDVTVNSRLACQIILDESNNGLKVRIP